MAAKKIQPKQPVARLKSANGSKAESKVSSRKTAVSRWRKSARKTLGWKKP